MAVTSLIATRSSSMGAAATKTLQPAAKVLRRRRPAELELHWPDRPKRTLKDVGLGTRKTWRSTCNRFEIRNYTKGSRRFTVWLLGESLSGNRREIIASPLVEDFHSLSLAQRECEEILRGWRVVPHRKGELKRFTAQVWKFTSPLVGAWATLADSQDKLQMADVATLEELRVRPAAMAWRKGGAT